ncbi:hypothetical protein HNR23_003552 [Nocardiopsis mwathae]|uniref:Uncharacterized protein n=1 Tax=Nocardiopsis mwathae TaxID=1472723 RepID=A0A7X0D6F7_9ACTN|nr:hypothetical protein [Nocardiopsis mwathae]MBB6173492.1 hypothetical protein [Nocardiopsis mwathae]
MDAILALGEPGSERERAELALERDGGGEFDVAGTWAKQNFHSTCSVRFDGERDGAEKTLYVMVYEDEGRWYVVLPFGDDGPGMWSDEEMLEEFGYESWDDVITEPGDEWEKDGAPCPE